MSKTALIGFHGSLFFMDEFEKPAAYKMLPFCGENLTLWLRNRYSKLGLRESFYKETKYRLKYINPSFFITNLQGKKCLTYNLYSQNNIWFPTSYQLKYLLGVNLKNKICADYKQCWTYKINKWKSHGKYMVGDVLFEVR